ncbi:MAG: DUF805 domain-containing protein [Hyphomicrobiaceae bacterium]
MGFLQAVGTAFIRYFDFQGRSRRSEYWWFVLFYLIVGLATTLFDIGVLQADLEGLRPVNLAATVVLLVPNLAVSVRRLHDIGKSGWWVLLILTGIGIIPLIYWYCQPGTAETNAYGPAVG